MTYRSVPALLFAQLIQPRARPIDTGRARPVALRQTRPVQHANTSDVSVACPTRGFAFVLLFRMISVEAVAGQRTVSKKIWKEIIEVVKYKVIARCSRTTRDSVAHKVRVVQIAGLFSYDALHFSHFRRCGCGVVVPDKYRSSPGAGGRSSISGYQLTICDAAVEELSARSMIMPKCVFRPRGWPSTGRRSTGTNSVGRELQTT